MFNVSNMNRFAQNRFSCQYNINKIRKNNSSIDSRQISSRILLRHLLSFTQRFSCFNLNITTRFQINNNKSSKYERMGWTVPGHLYFIIYVTRIPNRHVNRTNSCQSVDFHYLLPLTPTFSLSHTMDDAGGSWSRINKFSSINAKISRLSRLPPLSVYSYSWLSLLVSYASWNQNPICSSLHSISFR